MVYTLSTIVEVFSSSRLDIASAGSSSVLAFWFGWCYMGEWFSSSIYDVCETFCVCCTTCYIIVWAPSMAFWSDWFWSKFRWIKVGVVASFGDVSSWIISTVKRDERVAFAVRNYALLALECSCTTLLWLLASVSITLCWLCSSCICDCDVLVGWSSCIPS